MEETNEIFSPHISPSRKRYQRPVVDAWFCSAEAYLSRPVHMIVDIPAGLAPDVLARLVAEPLSHHYGQEFVVENRPGAGGNVGAEYVIRSAPDRYTLLVVISGNAANAALYPNLTFDFVHDITPVAFLGYTPFVVVVHPAVTVKTLPGAHCLRQGQSGQAQFRFAGCWDGAASRLRTAQDDDWREHRSRALSHRLFARSARGPSAARLCSGRASARVNPYRQAACARRDKHEAHGGVARRTSNGRSGWAGVGAPRGTPAEIIDTLNKNINTIIADPAMKARFIALGADDAVSIRRADC